MRKNTTATVLNASREYVERQLKHFNQSSLSRKAVNRAVAKVNKAVVALRNRSAVRQEGS